MHFAKSPSSLYFIAGPVFHKCLEIGVAKSLWPTKSWDYVFSLRRKGHHAGFNFFIEALGRSFELNVYDRRHWNYNADRFYLPGEKLEPEE